MINAEIVCELYFWNGAIFEILQEFIGRRNNLNSNKKIPVRELQLRSEVAHCAIECNLGRLSVINFRAIFIAKCVISLHV